MLLISFRRKSYFHIDPATGSQFKTGIVMVSVPWGQGQLSDFADGGTLVALTIGGAGASLPELIMLKRIFKAPLSGAFIVSETVAGAAES